MRSAIRKRPVQSRIQVIVFMACMLGSVPEAVAQVSSTPLPPVDTIARDVGTVRPGDLLKLTVYKQPDLSGTVLIDPFGNVDIPGIGSFPVAGLTPQQLKERFRQRLTEVVTNPDFVVTPQIRIWMLGEVGTQGLIPVEPGTTLIQALALAGGATERADLKRTRVIRDGKEFVVDLEAGLRGGGAGRIVLFSNDVVTVDRRRGFTRENVAFVMGGVTALLTLVNLVVSINK